MNTVRFLTLLLLTILPLTALGQQEHTVVLRGEPEDCVAVLAGSGSYQYLSVVSVEARAAINCKFVKWRVVKGLQYSEADTNPLTFQLNGDVELVAVFERLYETPGGGVVERVLVYTKTNVTGLPAKEPVVAMPGSEVRLKFERELYLGEDKYVFLYATVDDRKHDAAEINIKVPERGRVNATAYYYTYKRFLGDYYPLDQFVDPKIEVLKQVSDGARLRAVGYRVGTTLFRLEQKVPKQLLGQVEPEYVKEYRLIVYSQGAPANVVINGKTLYANPYAEAWLEGGRQLLLTVPERLERHRLQAVEAGGLAVTGNTVSGSLTGPATVTVNYRPIPNAFLLDVPVAGQFLLQVADLGTAVVGVEGPPALAAGLLIVASPAVAASAIALKSGSLNMRLPRGGRKVRAAPEVAAVKTVMAASLPHQSWQDYNEVMRVRGRIRLHPELKNLALELLNNTESRTVHTDEEEDVEVPAIAEEAGEALKGLSAGGKVTLSPAHIATLECDIDTYDTLSNALREGRLKVRGGLGFLGYNTEGARIARKLADGELVVVVKSADVRLGELVVMEACRQAGLSVAEGRPPTEKTPKKAAEQLRKQVGGKKVLLHTHGDEEGEALAARAAPLTGIQQVIISQNPSLPVTVELPEPTKDRYASIVAAMAAYLNLLERMTHEHIDYLAELAYSFRGVRTVEEALKEVEKSKDEPFEILRQRFRYEMEKTFTKVELALITNHESVEELRNSYIAYVRQTMPGTRPEKEWGKLYMRLKRIGIVE